MESMLVKLSSGKHARKTALSHYLLGRDFFLQSSAVHRNPGISFLPAVVYSFIRSENICQLEGAVDSAGSWARRGVKG